MDWSGIIGNIGGALVGGLFGQSSASEAASKQFERQKQLMQMQHDLQVDDYRHRYRWTVGDMRAAHLNPILAATNGIGGNINGVSAGNASAVMAPTPDFAGAFSSAYQTASQKEIAKMQNEVAKEDLRLKEIDINSAADKRAADTARENMMADVTKWSIEEQNKRSWEKVHAEIDNMRETLRIQEAHYERADAAAFASAEAHMVAANAAWNSSQVQSRLADIAEKTGYTQQQLNQAHEILLKTQTADAEELQEWHSWLNDHKELRGAVGLVGSMWDTYSTARKVQIMSNPVD